MLSLKRRPTLPSSSTALGPLRTNYTYIQINIIRPRKNNRYDMIYFIFIANQVKSWMHVPSSYYSWRNGGGRPIGFLFFFWLGVWGALMGWGLWLTSLLTQCDVILFSISAIWKPSLSLEPFLRSIDNKVLFLFK